MKNKTTLNIGLAVQGINTLEPHNVLWALYNNGWHTDDYRIETVEHSEAPPGGEKTMIVLGHAREGFEVNFDKVSRDLLQDCVAVKPDNGSGFLAGPRPYASGFSSEYFRPIHLQSVAA